MSMHQKNVLYLEVDDENEGVVVLNFLHRRLSREGIADDRIGVHAISVGRALPVKEKCKSALRRVLCIPKTKHTREQKLNK